MLQILIVITMHVFPNIKISKTKNNIIFNRNLLFFRKFYLLNVYQEYVNSNLKDIYVHLI